MANNRKTELTKQLSFLEAVNQNFNEYIQHLTQLMPELKNELVEAESFLNTLLRLSTQTGGMISKTLNNRKTNFRP